MQINHMMDEFMANYHVATTEMNYEELLSAHSLIDEELEELYNEAYINNDEHAFRHSRLEYKQDLDKSAVCKEMADIIYVTAQRMRRMGMDVDAIMDEVHRSNMSKRVPASLIKDEIKRALGRYENISGELADNGLYVMRCDKTGKVIKPTTYSQAVITPAMYH